MNRSPTRRTRRHFPSEQPIIASWLLVASLISQTNISFQHCSVFYTPDPAIFCFFLLSLWKGDAEHLSNDSVGWQKHHYHLKGKFAFSLCSSENQLLVGFLGIFPVRAEEESIVQVARWYNGKSFTVVIVKSNVYKYHHFGPFWICLSTKSKPIRSHLLNWILE